MSERPSHNKSEDGNNHIDTRQAPEWSHKLTPLISELRFAIHESSDQAVSLLREANLTSFKKPIEVYNRYEMSQIARNNAGEQVARVPLILALADIAEPYEFTLYELIHSNNPILKIALDTAGFQSSLDEVVMDQEYWSNDEIKLPRHVVAEDDLLQYLARKSRLEEPVLGSVSTGEFDLLLMRSVLNALVDMPKKSCLTMYGRPETLLDDTPELEALIEHAVVVYRKHHTIEGASNLPSTDEILKRITPIVKQGMLRLEITPSHISEPQTALINGTVMLQQRLNSEPQRVIVRIGVPSAALSSFVETMHHAYRLEATPILPTVRVKVSTQDMEELHLNLQCGCGGDLKYTVRQHTIYPDPERRVVVEGAGCYTCMNCNLTIFKTSVMEDIIKQLSSSEVV